MLLAGLDIGSTGAKLTVVDANGTPVHTGYLDYPVSRTAGAHEVDAALLWATVQTLLRDAAAAAPGFCALGITSFGESFVLLDENDAVLLPTMMYTDPRGEAQAARLGAALGAEAIADISGTLPHPMFSLPKLMWVRENLPDVYARARRTCLVGDYVAYMLTGKHVIDYSLAARTMGFDIRKLAWSADIFAAAGIAPALFGRPAPSGSGVGAVRPALAVALGLPPNLRVVLCGHDQIAAAVGSGVLAPGGAANGAGTVECVTPVFRGVPEQAALQTRNYSVVPFLGGGLYCCYAFSFTGGSLVKWFMEQLACGPVAQAKAAGANPYRMLEDASPDAPTGILVLPHFAGAATPYMDTGSQGAFVGLQLRHTTADLYRAVLEGVVYEMMVNLEKLAEAGVRVENLNASGGGARSAVWLQMKADILGVPVTRLAIDEAGTVGSILLTGVATGLYQSLAQGAAVLVKPVHTYLPRPAQQAAYREQYGRYRRMYEAVRPLMEG